ncbi:MAG: cytochrome c-type biogenesis protein CcmH [Rhodospirillales bacterium]|nr:MAG: cytochrome c-type biogenesis protein CcmH [Rhodospirillales bacterium]
MSRWPSAILAVVLLLVALPSAQAVQPDEVLDDPALEARAREISQNLRCLVCQNQSIDDSNAELARDLRIIVRQRLVAGDSNDEVFQFVVDRYGDYVLLTPPLRGTTFALWFGPLIILLIAGGALLLAARRRRSGATAGGLTAEEQARLSELLHEEPPKK